MARFICCAVGWCRSSIGRVPKPAAILHALMSTLLGTVLLLPQCTAASESGADPTAGAFGPIETDVAPAPIDHRPRVALVIGNGGYTRLPVLARPPNDANDICAALKTIHFEVICLIDVPYRREMRNAVREFASRLTTRSIGLFFYAGHGIQVNGENFLLPTRADIRSLPDVEYEGLSLNYLLANLLEARNSPNLIVLDACRDNPFPASQSQFVRGGLARVDPPIGAILAYATAPNGTAIDGEGRNGLFTKHLLQRLTEPGLKIDEMLQLVAQAVESEARESYDWVQTPYRSSSYSGDFCLAGCVDPVMEEKLEKILAQRDRLNARLEQLSEENVQLRKEAERGESAIQHLEERIGRLTEQANQRGSDVRAIEVELDEARLALSRARTSQQEREAVENENRNRGEQLAWLKTELERQATEIERYKAEIQRLQSEHAQAPSNAANPSSEERKRPSTTRRVIVPSF